ncbi:MAG: XdhC/CoxF family protein [Hyphomicrobiales bacterium]|nr:XdhC/CoxF family protein [Hyphomicrobiales bacterium]
MDKSILIGLNKERKARRAAIVLNDLGAGTATLIFEDWRKTANIPPEIAEHPEPVFRSGKSRMVRVEEREYFLNVYLPPTRLVVIGAVHISQSLALIAQNTGFDLEIIDPRTAFATPERFKNTKLSVEWPQTILEQRPLDSYSALIAVTHDPKIDDYAIIAALNAGCFYVGALGSRKTHAKRVERLTGQGVSKEQLGKIHAPIGMDIGAANPAEIAVAILAQVIGSFRQRGLGD